MPSFTVKGSTVVYTDAGSGSGAMLLHSSASSKAQWRFFVEALQGQRRVFAPDLWGYGESGERPGLPDLGGEAEIVEALAEKADGPIDLVGHSYGGAVALRFAIEWPRLVSSLVLIEPVAFHLLRQSGPGEDWLLAEVSAIAAAVRRDRGGSGMRRFVDYWSDPGTWDSLPADKRSGLARLAATVVENFDATLAEAIPLETYRRIQVPVLLLRGANSPAPTRRITAMLSSVLPNARLRTIAGAGHMLPLSHREPVEREILAHITRAASGIERMAA